MTGAAAAAAARELERVRDDPSGRAALAARFYGADDRRLRRYGTAELAFLRWEIARGVLAPPDADPPGSPWWRAVNERLLRDKAEAGHLARGAHGAASAASVESWVRFVRRPGPAAWYRAHNASIVAAYLEHEPLAAAELPVERFMMNVALLRVLFAHALVAQPALAAGPLAPVGSLLADPRRSTVGLFLDLRGSFPASYPVQVPLSVAIAREQPLARALDHGVIAPRLPELYGYSARVLDEPRLPELLDEGAPAYAWRGEDRGVWELGGSGRGTRLAATLTGVRDRWDRQFGGRVTPGR